MTTAIDAPTGLPALPAPDREKGDVTLRRAAEEMEVAFLAEMLKSAGLGQMPEGFGGGAGEEQFASFLREEQARAMVKGGGIGLAQSLFEALKERDGA